MSFDASLNGETSKPPSPRGPPIGLGNPQERTLAPFDLGGLVTDLGTLIFFEFPLLEVRLGRVGSLWALGSPWGVGQFAER